MYDGIDRNEKLLLKEKLNDSSRRFYEQRNLLILQLLSGSGRGAKPHSHCSKTVQLIRTLSYI